MTAKTHDNHRLLVGDTKIIDRLVPTDNVLCAILVEGSFPLVQTRTVPKRFTVLL